MKIGNLELENNVFLAPMAGITDITFRYICKKMGAGLVFTEMITARGVHHKNKKTARMTEVLEEEKPVGVQLFGSEPEIIAEACEYFNENDDIALIDINMGCPTKKVVKRGEGVALMKNTELAVEIIKQAKKASKKPITAKIRKGFDDKSLNALKMAKALEQAGVDAITVHGRTGKQGYSGKADWDIIKEVKDSVSVPVIGNGDIFSAYDAVKMFQQTGCDGVMVARGAMGNPWIFREIMQLMSGQDITSPTAEERAELCNTHLKKSIECYGEIRGTLKMQRQMIHYGIKCSFLKDNFGDKKKFRVKEAKRRIAAFNQLS